MQSSVRETGSLRHSDIRLTAILQVVGVTVGLWFKMDRVRGTSMLASEEIVEQRA